MKRVFVWLLLSSAGLQGCDQQDQKAPSSAATAKPILGSAALDGGVTYEQEAETLPLELLKFRFTSEVKAKNPVDTLDHASPGKRVYAHLTLRNRSGRPRKVQLTFKVNDVVRTKLELDVGESWEWRTYGYNTLLAKDTSGTLSLDVDDDEGHPLIENQQLPIRP